MSAPAWDSLAAAVKLHWIELAVSEVTVKEVARQVCEKIERARDTFSTTQKSLRAHGLTLNEPAVPMGEDFERDFRSRLENHFVQVLPLPTISHAELVARDIAVLPPFNRSGKGYRDALIWHSFLDWLSDGTNVGIAYFVSGNTADFAEKSQDRLAASLSAEVPSDIEVHLVEGLSKLMSRVPDVSRLPASTSSAADEDFPTDLAAVAMESAERAALNAFRSVEGESWKWGHEDQRLILDWLVALVEIDESNLEAEEVDVVSETTIWAVQAWGTAFVEGAVQRDNVPRLQPGWEFADDIDDEYLSVSRSFQCAFYADVRVEADGETAEVTSTAIEVDEA